MKKDNIWRMVWIVGIYVILLFIFYLVVVYKVKWENRDLNRYLYFYDCSGKLCTTDNKVPSYYASIVCPNRECPYIKESRGNFVILSNNKKEYLYNYHDKKVINDKYNTYSFATGNDYYIVSDDSGMYGIINIEGEPIVDVSYELITDYDDGYLAFKANDKYGIYNKEKNISIDPVYDKVLLINSKYFSFVKDDEYYIASYESREPINDITYNYLYPYNGAILTIRNGEVNIIDYDLRSRIDSPIPCFFPYTKESERATLKIKAHDNQLEFAIKNEEQNYDYYSFHTKNYILLNNKID